MSGLTPEEQQRIREEEELRFKTRRNLKTKQEWTTCGCFAIGVLIAYFIITLSLK